MLNAQREIKFSEYAVLYDMLIPKDNKYRLIDELIDFSFIYDELQDKYSLDNDRKAAGQVRYIERRFGEVIAEDREQFYWKNAPGTPIFRGIWNSFGMFLHPDILRDGQNP